ncbi:MAG: hypothetical protein ACRERV_13500 [Methylococcales bacterium]
MIARSIVWLRLSDLHACQAKTGWDAHRVLDRLIPDRKVMEKRHGLSPNLIFFTGDAAFGNIPILLHGHEHLGWVDAKAEGHVRVAAAACYERSGHRNGYNFVRLNLDTDQSEVWLRKYDADGGGWIPRAVAGKTDDSGLWLLNPILYLKEVNPKNPSSDISSGRFICQKITEDGFINFSSVSYPYGIVHDPTEFDDLAADPHRICLSLPD